MPFLSEDPGIRAENPVFCCILANTYLSTIPGVSGAGPTPGKTLITPILDAELIATGGITSMPARPDTPTGCPTPASITRAMMELTGIPPFFVNAGLSGKPTVPCIDAGGEPGKDPRVEDSVPGAEALFKAGKSIGRQFGRYSDLLVLGECVPGGTTTALCTLRALGYDAKVSSSYVTNPVAIKEEICRAAISRLLTTGASGPIAICRSVGDPMFPVALGISAGYGGTLVLAGGTQMLTVAALAKARGLPVPAVATTVFVRDDKTANFCGIAGAVGARAIFVDPGFDRIGHPGLARYCMGEVKEGMGAGGAMLLASIMGHSPESIRDAIYRTVSGYS